MTRVAYLSPFVPSASLPHAGGQFLHHYLTTLVTRVDATLIAPDIDANRRSIDGRPDGLDVHLVPVPTLPDRFVGRAVRYVRMGADGLSMGVGERRALGQDEAARRILGASDVIELHWSETLPLLPRVKEWAPTTPVVSVEYDVRHQVVSGRARRAGRWPDRALAAVAAVKVRRREPALLNRCDAVLTFTDKDIGLLRALGVTVRIERLDPYLAVPHEPVGPSPDRTIVFVAAFDRPENAEGARWFLDHVWPAVQRRCPDAVVLLAGAHPPSDLRARATPHVRVPGFVDDLGEVYRSARVVVCPLFTGGGIKFKVPQAMLYGLPVVATPVAADGIVDQGGASVFGAITAEPTAMAGAVADYLLDRDRAAAVGARARAWASQQYRFAESLDRVLALYDDLTRPAPG